MEPAPYTVVQAARLLDTSEAKVNRMIERGRIEVVGRGKYRAKLLCPHDVQSILHAAVGERDVPRLRTIATIDLPDDVDEALHVAGLNVKPAGSLLDAISVHYPGDKPVIVTTPERVEAERGLYESYGNEVWVAEWTIDESLRDLVRRVWRAVQGRKAAAIDAAQGRA